jgi:hypothetical protein
MNQLLLEQAVIEYRINHIFNTPHLKQKYLTEYKKQTGVGVVDEGKFRDWVKNTWSSAKYAASKLGSLEQGGKIIGRGAEKKAGKERYHGAATTISQNKITAPFWQAFQKKYQEFPNMKSQEEFFQALEQFGQMYDSVVAAVEKNDLDSEKANEAIYAMRSLLKVTLDNNLADIYKHFNESIDLSQIEIINEQEEQKQFTKKSKAQVEDDTDYAGETATVQGLKSNTLPAVLGALGALGVGFGWLVKQPWFIAMLKKPDSIGTVTKLIKAKGGVTQQLAILNGNPAADYSNMKVADFFAQMKSHGLIDAANKPTQNLLNIAKEAGNNNFGNWWSTNLLNATQNETLSQAIPLSGSGAAGAGGDVLTSKVLGSLQRVVKMKGAVTAGATLAKIAGPALMKMGIPLIAGGLAIKALRMKGLKSSRSQLLSTLLNQLKDVKTEGGDEGGGGGEGQPPRGPEGTGKKGETVYVYKRGGEDKNSLTRILMGLDLPNWAVKDLTDRVKKELEANNFVVKEGLLSEKKYDFKVGQGAVERKENPIDKLMSYKDIISNIEKQLKNNKYDGTVRDFIQSVYNDKKIKEIFSLNEAKKMNQKQAQLNQIADVAAGILGVNNTNKLDELTNQLKQLFIKYQTDFTNKKEGQGGVAVDDPKTKEEDINLIDPNKPVDPPKGPENEGITDEEIKDLVQRSKESFLRWKIKYNILVSKYSNLVAGGQKGASTDLIDFINEATLELSKAPNEKELDVFKKYYKDQLAFISGLSTNNQKRNQVKQTYLDAIENIKFKDKNTTKPPDERDAVVKPENPQGPQKPSSTSANNNKLLNAIQEFASDTTVEGKFKKMVKTGDQENENVFKKQVPFTRKQILDDPQKFLDALSPEEKMLLLRLPDNPNVEPSKVDFFRMTTDERKEMYNKVKTGRIDFGGNEQADNTNLEKKIKNLYNLIQSPNTPEDKKKKAKEELPKLQKALKDAEQRGQGREYKLPSKAKETKAGEFQISDLRDILRTGHTREDENEKDLQGNKILRKPIPDEKIRAAQKAITSYLSPYLKNAGVALRESQLDNVVLGFINEINRRHDNALFENRINRWKLLANIK